MGKGFRVSGKLHSCVHFGLPRLSAFRRIDGIEGGAPGIVFILGDFDHLPDLSALTGQGQIPIIFGKACYWLGISYDARRKSK